MMEKCIIKTLVIGAFVALGLTACNETWDEHYQEKKDLNSSETLWDVIQSQSELSDFANILKRTGYDELLQQNRFYTVWAPVNGFAYSEDNDSLLQVEFVENHIADYRHIATGTLEDNKVKMINGKYTAFDGAVDSYTFKENALNKKNISAKNGILHTISGYANFTANVWEQLAKIDSLSEINSFLKSFNVIDFDQNNSVQGPIVNGQITYLDSVVRERNDWFGKIGYLNREDSAYVMIAPTNEAWRTIYNKSLTYFAFAANDPHGDSLQVLYAKSAICNNLVYSKTINHMKDGIEITELDSLISNYRSYPKRVFYKEQMEQIFEGYKEKYELSNGDLIVVDKYGFDPRKCWHDTIKVEGENTVYIDGGTTCNFRHGSISRDSIAKYKLLSQGGWGQYAPTATTGNPKLTIKLPRVLSAPYLIKCVFIPANYADKSVTELKPNKFTAQLKYKDVTGKQQTLSLGSKITNDPTRIDTVTLIPNAKDITTDYFRFPVNEVEEYNLELINAQLILTSAVTSREKDFDRTFRLDCVILVPIDEETYQPMGDDEEEDEGE